jgi:hypothetical protein
LLDSSNSVYNRWTQQCPARYILNVLKSTAHSVPTLLWWEFMGEHGGQPWSWTQSQLSAAVSVGPGQATWSLPVSLSVEPQIAGTLISSILVLSSAPHLYSVSICGPCVEHRRKANIGICWPPGRGDQTRQNGHAVGTWCYTMMLLSGRMVNE